MKKLVLIAAGVAISLFSYSQKVCDGLAIGGPDKTICLGDSVLIGAQFQTGNTLYRWEPSAGLSNPNEYQTYASPGSTTEYLFIVTDTDFGCTDTDTVVVTVVEIALDLGPDTAVCNVINLLLDVGTAVKGTSYLWSDGSTNDTLRVKQTGEYWVEVSNGGCTLRDTIIVAQTLFIADIQRVLGMYCEGQTVPLTAKPDGGTYLWSTGETSQMINALVPGTYSVDVTKNGCTAIANTSLSGIKPPKPDAGPDTTICLGDSVGLGTKGATGNTIYSWFPSEIFANPNSPFSMAGPDTTTEIIYTVISTLSGCTGRDTVMVWVIDNQDLLPDTLSLCPGDSLVLSAPKLPQATYLWSSGETTQSITINNLGMYWVEATKDGCTNRDTVQVIELDINAQIEFSLGFACNGTTIPMSAKPDGASYLWSTGETTQNISALIPGSFSVTVSIGACSDSDSTFMINGQSGPEPDLGKDTTICFGDSIMLGEGFQTGNTMYTWSPAEYCSTPNNYQTICNIPVTTEIVLTMLDTRNGCSGRDTIKVWVLDTETAGIGEDTSICVGQDTITLSALPIPYVTYLWSTGETTREIDITKPGIFLATATHGACKTNPDSLNVEELLGCLESIEDPISYKEVIIYPNPVTSGFISTCDLTEVIDLSGKMILSTAAKWVNLREFPNGIYLIRFVTDEEVKFGKVVKH